MTAVAIALFTTAANAQVSVTGVMKRALAAIEKLEGEEAQILFVQVDNISKGQLSTQTYTLDKGSRYAVIALGDEERIQDIDLVVVDEDGEVAGKDSDDKNVAVVQLQPKKKQVFKLAVKGYKMSRDDGFFGIVICRLD